MTPLVALRDVRLRYPPDFTLEVAALDVRPAEVLGVIGPNGSGKSTLLRVLGLLERPETGTVLVNGRAVDARDGLAERRRMAMVFQDPLLADTTAAANVALGLGFRGIRGAAAQARVRRWLERFGVAALAERPARTLSGGGRYERVGEFTASSSWPRQRSWMRSGVALTTVPCSTLGMSMMRATASEAGCQSSSARGADCTTRPWS